jgi:hypothetical protein
MRTAFALVILGGCLMSEEIGRCDACPLESPCYPEDGECRGACASDDECRYGWKCDVVECVPPSEADDR